MASTAARLTSLRARLTRVAAALDSMSRDMAGSDWHIYRVTQARNLVDAIERLVNDVETGPVVKAQPCGICGATTVSLAPICGRCLAFYDRPAASKGHRRKPVAATV